MTMKMDKYYLMAEYDYHMMYKRSDMITYLQSLYILLDKHNLLSHNYPEELFDIGDTEKFNEWAADSGLPD